MQFKYHGNYCGPKYTGGSFTDYRYDVAPTDRLDSLCRAHDYDYSKNDEHEADHRLIEQTKFGLNKEGLLKLGFIVKDRLYNDLFVDKMPKIKQKQASLIPMLKPEKRTVAVVRGKVQRDKSESSNMVARDMPDNVDSAYLPSTYRASSGNRSSSKRYTAVSYHEEDEYIAEVNGSTSTTVPTVTTYAINPGQVATFPWLSKDALQWEKWGFVYMTFYYKPEVSEFNNQGSQGKVILACNYDATDGPPTTKAQLENLDPHVDGLPSHQMALAINPKHAQSRSLYTRPGNLPGQADIRLYDAGNLFVATMGCNGTGVCGELHVKYKVWYEVPIVSAYLTSAPVNNSVALFCSASAGEASGATGVVQTMALTQTLTNGIGAVNAAGIITLLAGNYLIDASCAYVNGGANITSAPVNNSVALFCSASAGEASGATGVVQTMALSQTLTNGIGAVNAAGIITLLAGNYLIDASCAYVNGGANITSAYLYINNTTSNQGGGGGSSSFTPSGSTAAAQQINITAATDLSNTIAPWFVACSGPQAIVLRSTVSFGAGSTTCYATLRIVSI